MNHKFFVLRCAEMCWVRSETWWCSQLFSIVFIFLQKIWYSSTIHWFPYVSDISPIDFMGKSRKLPSLWVSTIGWISSRCCCRSPWKFAFSRHWFGKPWEVRGQLAVFRGCTWVPNLSKFSIYIIRCMYMTVCIHLPEIIDRSFVLVVDN